MISRCVLIALLLTLFFERCRRRKGFASKAKHSRADSNEQNQILQYYFHSFSQATTTQSNEDFDDPYFSRRGGDRVCDWSRC